MRSVWMFISGLAVVIGVGGFVYYYFPQQQVGALSSIGNSSGHSASKARVLIMPADNPLLTASTAQFKGWFPIYPINCGEVLFKESNPKAYRVSSCISEIATRVKASTGIQLKLENILDPRVKDQWKLLG